MNHLENICNTFFRLATKSLTFIPIRAIISVNDGGNMVGRTDYKNYTIKEEEGSFLTKSAGVTYTGTVKRGDKTYTITVFFTNSTYNKLDKEGKLQERIDIVERTLIAGWEGIPRPTGATKLSLKSHYAYQLEFHDKEKLVDTHEIKQDETDLGQYRPIEADAWLPKRIYNYFASIFTFRPSQASIELEEKGPPEPSLSSPPLFSPPPGSAAAAALPAPGPPSPTLLSSQPLEDSIPLGRQAIDDNAPSLVSAPPTLKQAPPPVPRPRVVNRIDDDLSDLSTNQKATLAARAAEGADKNTLETMKAVARAANKQTNRTVQEIGGHGFNIEPLRAQASWVDRIVGHVFGIPDFGNWNGTLPQG